MHQAHLSIELEQKDVDRFWGYVQKTDGCWEWSGKVMRNGYGEFTVRRKKLVASRVSWVLAL